MIERIDLTNYKNNYNKTHPKKEKTSKKKTVAAAITGGTIGMAAPAYIVYDQIHKLTPSEARLQAQAIRQLMPEVDTLENTKKVSEKILKDSGLEAKKVKINFIDDTKESIEHLKDVIHKTVNPKSRFGKRLESNYIETIKAGANAAYCPPPNEIVVNSKSIYSSVYHELGHAMNGNGNKISKAIQKAGAITPFGVSLLAPLFLATGLCKNPEKNKPKEEQTKVGKTLDFISNNAGKLTLASYLPLLVEEGSASIRGVKAASKYLPKNAIKNLKTNYMKAWGSYAATASIVSAGVALGTAVSNKIREGKK